MKRKNLINLPKISPNQPGYLHMTENDKGGKDYSIMISNVVLSHMVFANLIFALNQATDKDTFTIKLASPGGAVDTGILICHAIFNTKAKVITQAMGITASIAATIWCAGHVRSLTPTATLMFHMPSGFTYGKTADLEEESGYIQKYFKSLLKDLTKGILTEEEFTEMTVNRTDIFLSYKELKRRLIKGV